MKALPNFRSATFLREHVLRTMAFYDGRCLDPSGGFFHFYRDDGSVSAAVAPNTPAGLYVAKKNTGRENPCQIDLRLIFAMRSVWHRTAAGMGSTSLELGHSLSRPRRPRGAHRDRPPD